MVLLLLLSLGYLTFRLMGEFDRPLLEAGPGGVCPRCGQDVADDWLLCPRCRTSLRESCAGCGRSRRRDHAFCPWCGRPREARP